MSNYSFSQIPIAKTHRKNIFNYPHIGVVRFSKITNCAKGPK